MDNSHLLPISSLAQLASAAPLCAGSIVGRRYILTAASCFKKQTDPTLYEIRIGDFNYAINEQSEEIIAVSNVTFGRLYEGGGGGVATIRAADDGLDVATDIALVELARDIPYQSAYVNEMCLPDMSTFAPTWTVNAFFFGWGEGGRTGLTSKSAPRYTTGNILSDENCNSVWGKENDTQLDQGRRICFESKSDSMKGVPCTGDEGGPLLLKFGTGTADDPERLMQVGIYGARDDTCSDQIPPVFTRITPYMRWINKQLACTVPGVYYPVNCPMLQ